MSVQATTFVYENAPENLKPSEMLTLLVLADHANGETGESYPSVGRIAKMARIGESTVRAALQSLCDRGIIKLEREATPKSPAFYRILNFVRGAGSAPGAGSSTGGVQDLAGRGAGSAPEPLLNRTGTIETNTPTPRESGTNPRALGVNSRSVGSNPRAMGTNPRASGTNPKSSGTDPERHPEYWTPERLAGFEVFWDAYPKKIEKQDALVAWRTTLGKRPGTDEEFGNALVNGYRRWIKYWREEETELRYIRTFARWIRGEQWTLDPRGVAK